eukprot:823863_1
MDGMIRNTTTDPRREIERLKPIANATSFPLNSVATNALDATQRHSPPNPRIVLPTSIKVYAPLEINVPNEKTSCPTTSNDVNKIIEFAGPTRSTRIPPKNGKTIFGNE